MKEITKKYLSIGEVSKLKGVSVKSLRYYGELGILTPAYINPQTGYRYYVMDQMILVDVICTCIELDIPLKNFSNYIKSDNSLNIEKILQDGKLIAENKIRKIKGTLNKLENISEHLSITEEVKKNTGVYKRKIKKRFFLTSKWDGDTEDIRDLVKKTTQLYEENLEADFTWNQGIICFYNENDIEKYVFVEVNKGSEIGKNMVIIPENEFTCEMFLDDNIQNVSDKFLKNESYPKGSILIGQELYDSELKLQSANIEVQVYVN